MLRNRPRLTITCGRCGKPREGIRHLCVSNNRRSATLKPSINFGKCGTCKKSIGNPLTHVCAPKSDFKARKSRAAKREKAREREKARKKRQNEPRLPGLPQRLQAPGVRGVQNRLRDRPPRRLRDTAGSRLAAGIRPRPPRRHRRTAPAPTPT